MFEDLINIINKMDLTENIREQIIAGVYLKEWQHMRSVKNAKLLGVINIPHDSYDGFGDAILFIRKNAPMMTCDKIVYYKDHQDIFETFKSNDVYDTLRVVISDDWKARVRGEATYDYYLLTDISN